MIEDVESPLISRLSWGRLDTADGAVYKDAKLFPGGGREWDWRETGTHHVPGIQPSDVEELLAVGVDALVLSTGHWRKLQVCPATLEMIAERGVDVRVVRTEEAVEVYNSLRTSHRVAGLFHSTC